MHRVIDDFASIGVGAVFPWLAQRERLRSTLADLLGARGPEEIGFVKTTSDGVIAIAQQLDWRKKDKVVVCRGEFPTNVTPWLMAAKTFGVEIVWIEADSLAHEEGLTTLKTVFSEGARLFALSAVEFQTGFAPPLETIGQICADHSVEFFVDGIQALGAHPLNVRTCHIDYLASGSHKWLMGMEGAGFLYIASHRRPHLIPRLASWLSHEKGLAFLSEGAGHLRYDRPISPRADFVESGALNTAGYAGLEASLDLILSLGIPTIFAHVCRYTARLEEAITEKVGWESATARLGQETTTILSYPMLKREDLECTIEALSSRGIAASVPDGHLRFAPHWPNDPDTEVDLIVDALSSI